MEAKELNLSSNPTILALTDFPDEKLKKEIESFGYLFESAQDNEHIETAMENYSCKIAIFDAAKMTKENMEIQIANIRSIDNNCRVLAVYKGSIGSKIKDVMAVGVDDIYQIPYDSELIINSFFEFSPIAIDEKNMGMDALVTANVAELNSDKPLPFDVYIALPANKKILKYRAKGHALDERTFEKSKKLDKFRVYIKKSDINAYRNYCSETIKNIYADSNMTKEQQNSKIKKEMAGMMQGYFSEEPPSEEDQKQMVENIRKVVENLEDESGSKAELKKAVMDLAAQHMTNYSHSKNVGTYCALFGQVLGINEPESLIMGGALHDIGLSDLPPDIVGKEPEELDEKEMAQYKLHPGNARYEVMDKKMKLPEDILKMIVQHHEHSDGSGFPYAIKANEIHPYAKICAFADRFDKLTSLRYGHKQLTPLEAVMKISGGNGGTADGIFDHEFHQPLVDYFVNLEEEAKKEMESGSAETKKPTPEMKIADGGKKPAKEMQLEGEALYDGKGSAQKGYVMETEEPSAPSDIDASSDLPDMNADLEIPDAEPKSTEDLLAEMAGGAATTDSMDANLEDLDSFAVEADSLGLDDMQAGLSLSESTDIDVNMSDEEFSSSLTDQQLEGVELKAKKPNAPNESGEEDNVYVEGADGAPKPIGMGEIKVDGPVDAVVDDAKQEGQGSATAQAVATAKEKSKAQGGQKDKGVDINARNKKGQTMLMHAAATGKVEQVGKLLEMGADVDAKDFSGHTSLMFASRGGHARVVQFLLRGKANINVRDGKGRSPLVHAIEGGHLSIVKSILVKGARTDFKVKGTTPLMLAAFLGDAGIVAALIENGADPKEKDIKGHTPLHYAMSKKHREAAAVIVKAMQG